MFRPNYVQRGASTCPSQTKRLGGHFLGTHWVRYDTIGEFNVDWKAEYSALSSTRSQKKKLKQPTPVPL